MLLDLFHPVVVTWFEKIFIKPTEVQKLAWQKIKGGHNTLIAAPTGSGKTLAAFLAAIDDLVRLGLEEKLEEKTYIVYISPLKALSNDVEKNLQIPLSGIREELKAASLADVNIRVAVRTGDTPANLRANMTKHPPHILVTTPESLYLLLTSAGGRSILSNVKTILVDEIHAMVHDKRGSHLALSIERLQALNAEKLVRIGLSATQKPVEKVAHFLTGGTDDELDCAIVDVGHTRKLDISIEVPNSPLTAVMAMEVWTEVYDKLVQLINSHQTTLIFVNTRRLAERMAFTLSEILGEDAIAAHHGSMSKDRRLEAEQKLKSGSLKALVATASLELGIDIGSVELVCQIGTSKSIAAFLQRAGRSGHTVYGTPKTRIFPLTRDELVESIAILDAVRRGELDQIIMPEKPIDILAQQIIAEVSCKEWQAEDLYHTFKKAYPFRHLEKQEFEEIIEMLSDGFSTRRGRRGAYLHYDAINDLLRGRKGARLSALTSGGAIPDNFDFDVIMEPANIFVGSVNEDFAIESLPGDIFLLGNKSYKIIRIENGKVKVEDAAGQPPGIPFWFGEAPSRTHELSFAVSRLREEISSRISAPPKSMADAVAEGEIPDDEWKNEALKWLVDEVRIPEPAADQLVNYLALAKFSLGEMPTQKTMIMERFFDEAGDMHVVIHSPYGSRLNRAWGLALRKRFCRKFNFELQAAASEDSIVFSLGSTHSFPLEEVYDYLKPQNVRDVLIQALLDSPMFGVRWRWNATRALAILRNRAGKRIPPQLQRMQAEDLVALLFPDQLACLENIVGEREVPDHPLIKQTIHDCLTEAMDIDHLEILLSDIQQRKIKLIAKDVTEPSPLAQEILNARPYAFLDDAPLEERRTRAVANRRWLDPSEMGDLGKLDDYAIELVKTEAWPSVENADELHDALVFLGFITKQEGEKGDETGTWSPYFYELKESKRATEAVMRDGQKLWIAAERINYFLSYFNNLSFSPTISLPERLQKQIAPEKAILEIVRGRTEALGPVTASRLAVESGISLDAVNLALLTLENEGFIFRGKFTSGATTEEWCERRLLARIHRYTIDKLRKEIEAVSPADYMRFLFKWHKVIPGDQQEGFSAFLSVLQQIEGFETPAAAWESDILPLRVKDYDHQWLDMACLAGKVVWGRFRLSNNADAIKPVASPIKTTPIMIINRNNLDLWKQGYQDQKREEPNLSSAGKKVWECLISKGALFFNDIASCSALLSVQAETAISELVAAGLVTSDSFTGLRTLLVPAKYKLNGSRKSAAFTMDQAGRWSLLKQPLEENKNQEYHQLVAKTLLNRYGVVFRKVCENEPVCPPWREMVKIFRLMEARGEIRGGRFVDGMWGEQFALPEAVPLLRNTRKTAKEGLLISVSATDPLNLQGIITPGKKISSFPGNRILFRDGIPIATFESGSINFLEEIPLEEKWKIQNALIQRKISPKLKAYLGKGIA